MSIEAAEFILDLAKQSQLLACLHWLDSFQVLACIPLIHPVTYQDVADMVGVPAEQLARVIRMTATASFLHEPQPGCVAHTPLSAQFVTRPSLQDAVTFICDTAVPSALHMIEATRLSAQSPNTSLSAYNVVSQSPVSLASECERQPKLKRQMTAFQRLSQKELDGSVTTVLSTLDWHNLGTATIVEIGPQSIAAAQALASKHPDLSFIVQMVAPGGSHEINSLNAIGSTIEPPSRVTVEYRTRGSPQTVETASVYVLHLPQTSFSSQPNSLSAQITAELQVHFNLLRKSGNAKLIVIAHLLPEPGITEREVEAAAYCHDLALLQMANNEVLKMTKLEEILGNVRDTKGRFVVVNKSITRQHSTVALQVRIQSYADRQW